MSAASSKLALLHVVVDVVVIKQLRMLPVRTGSFRTRAENEGRCMWLGCLALLVAWRVVGASIVVCRRDWLHQPAKRRKAAESQLI